MKSHQIEVINRHRLISHAIEKGFNAFLPVYDDGIDLILHGGTPEKTYLVQLKGRWTIGKKYMDRNIHIAFPHKEDWYLAPHDALVAFAEKNTNRLSTESWLSLGRSSAGAPSKEMLTHLLQFKF